jgi:hypothetical protein
MFDLTEVTRIVDKAASAVLDLPVAGFGQESRYLQHLRQTSRKSAITRIITRNTGAELPKSNLRVPGRRERRTTFQESQFGAAESI